MRSKLAFSTLCCLGLFAVSLPATAHYLWMQEHHSNENGKVKITTPWPGLYVPEVIHTEKQLGEFQGKKSSAVCHLATLSFNTRIRNHGK